MANGSISLANERLNRIEDKLDQVLEILRELQIGQNDAHAAVVGLRGDHARDAEVAPVQTRLDSRAANKIERIERRLDLRDNKLLRSRCLALSDSARLSSERVMR